jgi:hypothetical protein
MRIDNTGAFVTPSPLVGAARMTHEPWAAASRTSRLTPTGRSIEIMYATDGGTLAMSSESAGNFTLKPGTVINRSGQVGPWTQSGSDVVSGGGWHDLLGAEAGLVTVSINVVRNDLASNYVGQMTVITDTATYTCSIVFGTLAPVFRFNNPGGRGYTVVIKDFD